MKHIIFTAPLLLAPLVLVVAALGSQDALAQPGTTPPGSMPPYSAPPPSYGPGPYYGPPMPPMPPPSDERVGWHVGLGLGLGSMDSSAGGGFACANCEGEPAALALDLHVGSMITPRLALQGELWFQFRTIDADGNASVSQRMLMLAAQYWLTPRLWIKGGLGYAALALSYNDGFEDRSEDIGEGAGFMAAIGYELVSSRNFGFDVQLKTGIGTYDENEGEEVTATVLAFGLNWY